MDLLFSVLSGILQGLTEFLPISSSGHLALLEKISYFKSSINLINQEFSILMYNFFLHLGTLCAVCIFYRKDLKLFFISVKKYTVLRSFKNLDVTSSNSLFILFLLFFSCVPMSIALFLNTYVEIVLDNIYYIGLFYIFNAIILFLIYLLSFPNWLPMEKKEIFELNIKFALLIGTFQLLAIFPGVSRSGITILLGLICGLKMRESIRYSFLLSIPILLVGFLVELPLINWESTTLYFFTLLIIGFFLAFFVGLLSIYILHWFAKKQKFHYFGIYSLILGLSLSFLAFNFKL